MSIPIASAFISYSHQDRDMVYSVAEALQADDIHVWLDEWDVRTGDSLVERISAAIHAVDFVMAFISAASVGSEWCRKEISLAMTGELADRGVKVLPVRVDNVTMPSSLKDKKYLDATGLGSDEIKDRLATDMHAHLRPGRTLPPRRVRSKSAGPSPVEDGPIRIVGVDAQGITSPRNDGTPGSALYRVPILLSQQPDQEWAELMEQNWDRPPRHTSMHRPGIGSVSGRTFVLDGTTLEEVEQHHLETLEHAIGRTNQQYEETARRQRAQQDAAAVAQQKHESQVASALERLNARFTEGTPESGEQS
ncbi:toll/interleukin-1 receptor domain-containing protein [Pseudactinotalea sp. Z1748]|uniref:toll/interleukin-1 receptor domain-containing protein n=1 Tax=Pseudactinotalea sp. Z1748 TaxID=3413027 RepID=UPI003C7B6C3C